MQIAQYAGTDDDEMWVYEFDITGKSHKTPQLYLDYQTKDFLCCAVPPDVSHSECIDNSPSTSTRVFIGVSLNDAKGPRVIT